MAVRRMTREQWLARGRELYGEDMRRWKFRCVACGHVQSHELAVKRKADIGDTSSWIAFSCEGRRNLAVGCDWTLGGLFQIHKLEVVDGDRVVPCFEFADDAPDSEAFVVPAEDPIRHRVKEPQQLRKVKASSGERARVLSTGQVWRFERGLGEPTADGSVIAVPRRRGRWLLESEA